MRKVWDKIADIATWIFIGGIGLILLGIFLFAIGSIITGVWIYLWALNKFVFSIFLFFLICGLIAVIDWLIRCIHG